MAYSFAPRLRLAPLWPALAALALAAVLASILLPRTLAEAATAQLAQETRLLMAAVPEPATFSGPDLALEGRLRQLVAGTDFRITVVAIDGTVLADSDRRDNELAAMDNHRSRPEIAAALARGEGSAVRHSDTTGQDTLYAARLVRNGEGRSWILRLGQPLSTISTLNRHLTRILMLAVLAALVLVALVSWWLTRALFRPLGELLAAADVMGRGDYTAPFRIPEQRELARLGNSLARIARHAGEQLRAVEAERDHLRATVAGMAEGVLVTDARGKVRLFNPAFCDIFGVPGSASPAQVLDLAREPRLVDLVQQVLADGNERSLHLERMEPVRRTLALAGAPLGTEDGAVVVVRDITEAEHLNRMRRDFVANVSHELRTPLSAIQGYAETLCDGALDERDTAQRFSQRIVDQCRRLAALLADLLTLSRLEGKEPLETLEPVDLRAVAREALELVSGQAATREVTVELVPGPSPVVPGDPEGLFRLISNLLENAVKYNQPGGRVDLTLASRQDHPPTAVIEVQDTGIGIPGSALPRIFERFYRVDKGRAREEGGTGLGLAIVKHVAQAHQGRVEVESELGRGSKFRVFLPTERP
ncbi:MAG: PAS domain-containing protein [Thermoanaerobaculia bacterium]|nr:PAS domain-containing protein [Thermoanaerobaculia bacterium]